MAHFSHDEPKKRSIFRSVFFPVLLIMVLQSVIFYFAAVYGGIENSLSQNAADIFAERMIGRKKDLETRFSGKSFHLDDCEAILEGLYAEYETRYGIEPLTHDGKRQIQYLSDCSDVLIDTLRQNEVNGIFLILNDSATPGFPAGGEARPYGLCIRDMDQDSNYTGREDLLLERAPSSMIDDLGCPLDSWWEARYTFSSEAQGDYYYRPLEAAWENPGAAGKNLAYFSGAHRISGSDPAVASYSLPLLSKDGYPYGVLGVELTTKYLSSLLPNNDFSDPGESCYVLALQEGETGDYVPIVGAGALFLRCFGSDSIIPTGEAASTGGFRLTARGDTQLYGDKAQIQIYSNNSPFENNRFMLLALTESDALFAYISQIKVLLLLTSLFCLALGSVGILLVSRRFASPITNLSGRVRNMQPRAGISFERLGITEIDQLVDAIEELNRNVSRSSARTEFFSRMSHDMRTPMNAIISLSSPELLDGASERTKDDYLNNIHAAGDYLLGLINEVLDITKIESNKIELRPVPIQIKRLCSTAIPIIEKLAQAKNVSFHSSSYGDSDDACVLVDAQYFDQILINLLSNAVKFTPGGGDVALAVHTAQDGNDPERMRCEIRVSDSGIGMSPEFIKKLYVPFEQENSTREGTGLGLSIVKKLVDLMGGTIHCASRKYEGTTFTVELPLTRSADVPQAAAAAAPVDPSAFKSLRGKRVLVCEDNSINTQIVCRLLERAGVVTETAANGQAGVAAFAASPINGFDGVLMDIRMPVMDGLAAARAIRALPRPDAATVPILAMTANAFDEDVEQSRAAGMNDHLAKPIDTRRFFSALLDFLAPDPNASKD